MIDVVDFEKAWLNDRIRYEIGGTLLKCVDPKGMLLLSMERLQQEGPQHAILLEDEEVVRKVLTLAAGSTGGPSFARKAKVSATIEKVSGKFSFRMKDVYSISILDCLEGPKSISFEPPII